MTEMIERVGAAICKAQAEVNELVERDCDNLCPWREAKAKAAISAMREPTKGMICQSGATYSATSDVAWWEAMIDAALED